MMHQVRLMMFSLNIVDYSMSFLSLSSWDFFFAGQVGGTILNLSYSLTFIVGPLLHGPWDFSVSPRPLGFGFLGFGANGLGPGLDNLSISRSIDTTFCVEYLGSGSRPSDHFLVNTDLIFFGLRKCLVCAVSYAHELSLNGAVTALNTFVWNWQDDHIYFYANKTMSSCHYVLTSSYKVTKTCKQI